MKKIEKYNQNVPRYTSYPPATEFFNDFSLQDFSQIIQKSNSENPNAISLYLHLPFCFQQCFYCGCNTSLQTEKTIVQRYVKCLIAEIKIAAKLLDKNRQVTQIHFGGGTPNFLKFSQLRRIFKTLRKYFSFTNNCEYSIELSPAYLTENYIKNLAKLPFNRISLGIQDFHKEILNVVNRKSSKIPLDKLMKIFRENQIKKINFDLIYGLPLQNLKIWEENLQKIIELKPNRVATFSFAHLPNFLPHQNNINSLDLPTAKQKLQMLKLTQKILKKEYIQIGLDHFALPQDELAIAAKNSCLHRNFQGYCTAENTGQVYAFGASAIWQLSSSYAQNFREIEKYCDAIENKNLAIFRGYNLTNEEQVCRDVINSIMCNSKIDFNNLAKQHQISVEKLYDITSFHPDKFDNFIADKLIKFEDNVLRIMPLGKFLLRNIAACFDPKFQNQSHKFSNSI